MTDDEQRTIGRVERTCQDQQTRLLSTLCVGEVSFPERLPAADEVIDCFVEHGPRSSQLTPVSHVCIASLSAAVETGRGKASRGRSRIIRELLEVTP